MATAANGRIPRISRLTALAIRFDRLIKAGEITDQAEIAFCALVVLLVVLLVGTASTVRLIVDIPVHRRLRLRDSTSRGIAFVYAALGHFGTLCRSAVRLRSGRILGSAQTA